MLKYMNYVEKNGLSFQIFYRVSLFIELARVVYVSRFSDVISGKGA